MGTVPKPEGRTLRRTNRQTMVALPAWVRRRLDAAPGDVVYWHGHRRGEVVLASHAERVRGAAGRADVEEELRAVVAERDSLKQALTGHELGAHRAVYAAGAMQGLRIAGPTSTQLDAILRELAALRARVEQLPGAGRRAHRRTTGARARPVESVTLPAEG